jgi:hypothetical protein
MVARGQTGTVGIVDMVIPQSSITGEPVVVYGDVTLSPAYSEFGNQYYIYFSYSQGSENFSVGGTSTIAELPGSNLVVVLFILIAFALLVRARAHDFSQRWRIN